LDTAVAASPVVLEVLVMFEISVKFPAILPTAFHEATSMTFSVTPRKLRI